MDEQAPLPLRPSSNQTYFTLQALRAGYLKPANLDFRTWAELRAAVLREMENEQTRRQIIEEEIARRRAAEFWRRNDYSYPYNSSFSEAAVTRYEATLRFPTEEERSEMSLEERLGWLAAARRAGFGASRTGSFHFNSDAGPHYWAP